MSKKSTVCGVIIMNYFYYRITLSIIDFSKCLQKNRVSAHSPIKDKFTLKNKWRKDKFYSYGEQWVTGRLAIASNWISSSITGRSVYIYKHSNSISDQRWIFLLHPAHGNSESEAYARKHPERYCTNTDSTYSVRKNVLLNDDSTYNLIMRCTYFSPTYWFTCLGKWLQHFFLSWAYLFKDHTSVIQLAPGGIRIEKLPRQNSIS